MKILMAKAIEFRRIQYQQHVATRIAPHKQRYERRLVVYAARNFCYRPIIVLVLC